MHFYLLPWFTLTTVISAQNSSSSLSDVLSNTDSLSSWASYLKASTQLFSELEEASDITILIPSNAAIEKLNGTYRGDELANDTGRLQALLNYHVLDSLFYVENASTSTNGFVTSLLTNSSWTNVTNGQAIEYESKYGSVTLTSGLRQEASVSEANLNFTNGVIQILDTVLYLPRDFSNTAIQANLTAAYGAFSKVGLDSSLEENSDITVFVPNNDAFQIVASSLESLDTFDLTNAMQYHYIGGSVIYSTELGNRTLTTSEGDTLQITQVEDGSVYVNSAKIVVADLLTANGVIHVIDNVLNPNSSKAVPNPTIMRQDPVYTFTSTGKAKAKTTGGVPFTSNVPTPSEDAYTATTPVGSPPTGSAGAKKNAAAGVAGARSPMVTGAVVGAGVLFFGEVGGAVLGM